MSESRAEKRAASQHLDGMRNTLTGLRRHSVGAELRVEASFNPRCVCVCVLLILVVHSVNVVRPLTLAGFFSLSLELGECGTGKVPLRAFLQIIIESTPHLL